MNTIKDNFIEAHFEAKEYLAIFKNILPLMAKEYDLKKFNDLIKFFHEHIIPHFNEEENFFQTLLNDNPKQKILSIIIKIQKEHIEILAMFELFSEKIKTVDNSKGSEIDLTHSCITLIDAILKHADYEDKNLAPLY
ncbi:hemerythrin domain-containing protein [bacterium]|nr:hemerythrin domain-containing protein [bacterium]